jgi:hypothetical protein
MIRFAAAKMRVLLSSSVIALGVTVSFGGTGAKAPELSKGAAAARARIIAAENRRALEAYEKRNAKITPWDGDSVPANTDNAALLYYQACLFVPEPNEAMRFKIRPGAELTPELRTYMGQCLVVIEMVETASRIPGCTWAVWPEGGLSQMPWTQKIGSVTDIVLLDAEMLAVEGHYRVALERCLTARRIAKHLNDDPELHMFATGVDGLSLYTIKNVLGLMPPDADTLTWFRGQFAEVLGPRLSFAKTLQRTIKIQLDAMKTHPDHLAGLRNVAIMKAEGEQAKENVRNLTDEQFRLRAREGLARFTDSILRILDSEATHEQKLAQMKELVDQKMEDEATDPVVKGILSGINMRGQIDVGYTRGIIEREACINGTKAAVEVYLVLAKTGRLPEKLPNYLPKDPFTGQDFGYNITDEGFALRCQGEEFLTRKKSLLEFRVHK